jgi:ABC-type branched-subunit amino acid transport system permease subunit
VKAPPASKWWLDLALMAAAFVILPYLMPGGSLDLNPLNFQRLPFHAGFVDLGTTILVFSLFAIGFNLLFGHSGELSFGHAMFFAWGCYATALFTKGFTVYIGTWSLHHDPANNLWIALALSLGLAALWAWLLARLIVPRSSGIYYSMITLAFAQVIFFVAFRWSDLTGGEDGIQAISRPPLPGLPPDWMHSGTNMYVFTAVVTLIALAVNYWIVHSPFGSVLHAIRENKQRARFLGYDVNRYRVNAFVLSALFPAVGGWLWAYSIQAINPDAASVDYSGRVVMMSLLGGIHAFAGPILGAFVYWDLQNSAAQVTPYWAAAIGIVFVFFVLAAPGGIAGTFEVLRRYGIVMALRRTVSEQARLETDLAEELRAREIDAAGEARS